MKFHTLILYRRRDISYYIMLRYIVLNKLRSADYYYYPHGFSLSLSLATRTKRSLLHFHSNFVLPSTKLTESNCLYIQVPGKHNHNIWRHVSILLLKEKHRVPVLRPMPVCVVACTTTKPAKTQGKLETTFCMTPKSPLNGCLSREDTEKKTKTLAHRVEESWMDDGRGMDDGFNGLGL